MRASLRKAGKSWLPVPAGGVGSTGRGVAKAAGLPGGRAVSGRESTHDYLRQLGADAILPRSDFAETRPLEKQLWAGAVDTVGGTMLAKVLAQTQYRGCVAACGLAGASICDHRDAVYSAQRAPAGGGLGDGADR